jgi:hypothetical protein
MSGLFRGARRRFSVSGPTSGAGAGAGGGTGTKEPRARTHAASGGGGGGGPAPYIVETSLSALSRYLDALRAYHAAVGYATEGLYRRSSAPRACAAIYEAFAGAPDAEEGGGSGGSLDETTDPHAVAGALKLLLRGLREPLLPFALYGNFMSVPSLRTREGRVYYLQVLVSVMSPARAGALAALFSHLHSVGLHAGVNLMTFHNLATIMAPNLLRPRCVRVCPRVR